MANIKNPVADAIKRYETLRKEFATSLEQAGGNSAFILASPEWIEVLAVLAANNITISAQYQPYNGDVK